MALVIALVIGSIGTIFYVLVNFYYFIFLPNIERDVSDVIAFRVLSSRDVLNVLSAVSSAEFLAMDITLAFKLIVLTLLYFVLHSLAIRTMLLCTREIPTQGRQTHVYIGKGLQVLKNFIIFFKI